MKRLAAAGLFLALSCLGAAAQSGHPSVGYQQITSLASATNLIVPTATGGAVWALICVETANVRWRDDGTAPTASVGQPVSAGQCFQYAGPLPSIQFIAQSGSPVVNVSYYR
jgi:hypothetical protein